MRRILMAASAAVLLAAAAPTAATASECAYLNPYEAQLQCERLEQEMAQVKRDMEWRLEEMKREREMDRIIHSGIR